MRLSPTQLTVDTGLTVDPPAPPFGVKLILGLGVLIFASFMVPLDSTIVVVALPALRRELMLPGWQLNFVVDGYSIFFGSMLLTGGALADRLGRKKIFLAGTLLFAAASLACGLSMTGAALIGGRCIQGFGGAIMLSSALGLISELSDVTQRSKVYAAYSSALGLGAALGPFCGGLLVQYLDWRWCFFVNILIAGVVCGGAIAYIPSSSRHGTKPLDVAGTLAFTASLFLLCYACLALAGNVHLTRGIVLSLIFSLLSLLAFLAVESRVRFPMISLQLLFEPRFLQVNITAALSAASFWSTLAYIPRYMTMAHHLSPLQAGVSILPLTLPLITGPFLAHRLLRYIPSSIVMVLGGCLIGGGWLLYRFSLDGSTWGVILAALLAGTGAGMTHSQLAFSAVNAVPPESSGMASGFVSTMRQSGLAIGVAVLANIFDSTSHAGHTLALDPALLHARMQSLLTCSAAVGFLSAFAALIVRGRSTALEN